MRRFLAAIMASFLLLTGCAQQNDPQPVENPPEPEPPAEEISPEEQWHQEVEAWQAQRTQQLQALLDGMTLEEKVGQLFFVRCPEEHALEDLQTYHLGGYLLFSRDFKDGDRYLTRQEVIDKLQGYQDACTIPLLIGSDEEGGTVTRASHDPELFASPIPAPQALYNAGGMDAVLQNVVESQLTLRSLGINVNFAPVCDVSTDPADFIYPRTLGQNADVTAEYVGRTVLTMGDCGMMSVLKHFPGYGNNADTHTGVAVDQRPMETFETSDLLPFRAGIDAGAPFVLVSHNIVTCMDTSLPASLSPEVHRLLRQDLGFEGLILTDDLAMDAVKAYAPNGASAVMALQAGNDMVVTTDYRTQIPAVIAAVESGELSEDVIDTACLRVLSYKDQWFYFPALDS